MCAVIQYVPRAYRESLLKQCVDHAASGRGQFILLGCEGGMAKTHMLNALKDHALSKGFQYFISKAHESRGSKPAPYRSLMQAFSKDAAFHELLVDTKFAVIEEIFLVDNSGILITHISQKARDASEDIVAGMLTAIQDFVRESFIGADSVAGVKRLDYRDKTILIERGEYIYLTALANMETSGLRSDLRKTLRVLEQIYGKVLRDWGGDKSKLAGTEHLIETLLSKTYRIERTEFEREKLVFDKVLLYIRKLAAHRPLILVLDELQWADRDTLRLLTYFARAVASMGTVICGTYRPELASLPNPLATVVTELDREKLYVDVRFEPRKLIDREYGMRLFGPFLAVRIPKRYVNEFNREDSVRLLARLNTFSKAQLRREVEYVYFISEMDFREIKLRDFYNVFIAPNLSARIKSLWDEYLERI